jgi:UDP-N-acetylmuramoyl-tripeptide--D-alanyl-D-alanine ligase
MVGVLKRKIPWQLLSLGRATVAAGRRLIYPLALAYRIVLLRRVVFIGVTGSAGKTTAKELIGAILASRFSGDKNEGNTNVTVHRIIYRARPWHKYYVQEIGIGNGIRLEKPLRLVRPSIGVVTNIGTDHLSAYGSVEAIAAEKGKLIAALPKNGVAILNADDPNVLAMKSRCRGRVITYGLAPNATIRAVNISGNWPDRLAFDVLYGGQCHTIQSQLCGTHWVPCILAAIAVALEMGIPLEVASHAIEMFPPVEGRMQPVIHPDGITFIRDDVKAPMSSIGPTLDFVRTARARRKVVIVGMISDYKAKSKKAYVDVAMLCLQVADLVIFIGPNSAKCFKGKKDPGSETLRAFYSLEAASEYLSEALQPGDMVLLKGSRREFPLEELYSSEKKIQQPPCSREPRALPQERMSLTLDSAKNRPAEQPRSADDGPQAEYDSFVRAVIGLGNPEKWYRDTPHNVGFRVLDRLADALGGTWEQLPDALVACVEWKKTKIYLIKPMKHVNNSGPVALRLCQKIGVGPADCILVQDDMHLTFGSNRIRMRGSDGGHKGVRSVLQALRTDMVPRVKIGVGHYEQRSRAWGPILLRRFAPEELVTIDAACAKAADSVMELVSGHVPTK